MYPFDYSHTGVRGGPAPCAPRWGCVWPCIAPCSLDRQKKMRSAVRLRSSSRFSARLGSSGRSRDAPGMLQGSIFKAEMMVSSTFVAWGMHASARPPDPHETLRGRMNFKLRACCEGPNIGRKLASKAARRRVHAGNAIGKGPEATQEGQLGARDCQLGAPNTRRGGQDGQFGGQDSPTWRSEDIPSASRCVPEPARVPKPPKIEISSIFHRFSIDFSTIFAHCARPSDCAKRFFFAQLTAFD